MLVLLGTTPQIPEKCKNLLQKNAAFGDNSEVLQNLLIPVETDQDQSTQGCLSCHSVEIGMFSGIVIHPQHH